MTKAEEADSVTPGRSGHTTIATIAAHLGLSRATVTHVLNGRAAEQRIRPETQRRVLDGARELGYRPNPSARAVRAGRYGSVALIQSLRGQYMPGELLFGVTHALSEKDLRLVLTHVLDVPTDDTDYLPDAMRALAVDGALVNRHVGFPLPFLEHLHRLRIPAISVNVRQEFDCVHPDERMGGRLAAERLLELGHERVAYIDSEVSGAPHFSRDDRRAGFAEALESVGRSPRVHLLPERWPVPGHAGVDARVESARDLLSGPPRPTGVVCYEVAEAMATVHAAQSLGLRVPLDLSVIVFHHWIDDRFFLPFHTVLNVMAEVGQGAVDLLAEKIENPEAPLVARAVPVRLLDGATCLPPPAKT